MSPFGDSSKYIPYTQAAPAVHVGCTTCSISMLMLIQLSPGSFWCVGSLSLMYTPIYWGQELDSGLANRPLTNDFCGEHLIWPVPVLKWAFYSMSSECPLHNALPWKGQLHYKDHYGRVWPDYHIRMWAIRIRKTRVFAVSACIIHAPYFDTSSVCSFLWLVFQTSPVVRNLISGSLAVVVAASCCPASTWLCLLYVFLHRYPTISKDMFENARVLG